LNGMGWVRWLRNARTRVLEFWPGLPDLLTRFAKTWEIYQIATTLHNSHKMAVYIPNDHSICRYTNLFHSKAFQNSSKLGFLVRKYTHPSGNPVLGKCKSPCSHLRLFDGKNGWCPGQTWVAEMGPSVAEQCRLALILTEGKRGRQTQRNNSWTDEEE
jgi:hypothetical protein